PPTSPRPASRAPSPAALGRAPLRPSAAPPGSAAPPRGRSHTRAATPPPALPGSEGASSPSSAHPHRASADHLRCLNGFNVDIPQGPRYVKHLGGGSVLGSRGGSLSGNLPGAQAGEVDFGGEDLHPERLHGAADQVVAVAAAQQRGGAAAAR